MYAFIFGAEGLNDIITQFQIVGSALNLTSDATNLILRISQSDYDMIQCQGFKQDDQLEEQSIKGLNKLFQTIFLAQTIYNTKDLILLLKQFGYDTNFDVQNCILIFCELNPDNNSVQLKKTLLPTQYEPVFGQQVLSLKDKIEDKLKSEGDFFTQYFGNALANELSNSQSTLTFKRFAILKAIAQEENQIILNQMINQIYIYYYLYIFNFYKTVNRQNTLNNTLVMYWNLKIQNQSLICSRKKQFILIYCFNQIKLLGQTK